MLGTTLAHQRGARRQVGAHRHDHDRGFPRRAGARAPAPPALLQSRHSEADAAGAARLPARGRRAHRARRRGSRRRSTKSRCASAVGALQATEASRRSRSASCMPTPIPAHERARARRCVRELWPEVYVCASHEVLAEFREFERFATTTVNASLMPVMDRYLERFERGVRGARHRGGAARHAVERRRGVAGRGAAACRSTPSSPGPAGGVDRQRRARRAARRRAISSPSTWAARSTDVCLIRDGEPAKKSEREMGGFPVRTRTLDIHTIGAGGGSIAWVDAGGLLKVGPQSAGAYPGPAAYGRGGTQADRDRRQRRARAAESQDAARRAHGDASGRARAARSRRSCAATLGVDSIEAAAGVIEIINVNMMGAVRVISVEQGEDPRDFTLVAFGGAGPLHAADVARSMGIRQRARAAAPGAALGDRAAARRRARRLQPDAARARAAARTSARSTPGFAELRDAGARMARRRGGQERARTFDWLVDLRYVGQNFELIAAAATAAGSMRERSRALVDAFHRAPPGDSTATTCRDQPVEIVNLRLVGDGRAAARRRRKRRARARQRRAGAARDAQRLVSRDAASSRRRSTTATGCRRTARSPARRSSSRWTRRRWCRPRRGCATTGSAICTWQLSRCPLQAAEERSNRQPQRVDPIRAEVVARYLLATAEEMGATLMRTAFSPNIKERADCSTAIFDAHGPGRSRSRSACRSISARWSARWTRS